jgi:ribulose-phosphate 3-epimerase
MIEVLPSILSADFARLGEEIAKVERAGASFLHVDVMDGHFVPNISIGIPVVESIRKVTRLKLDIHLMISDPDKYAPEFIRAGGDYILVHQEACTHPPPHPRRGRAPRGGAESGYADQHAERGAGSGGSRAHHER